MLNLFRSQSVNFQAEVLSGLTVALALVPEAIAFSFLAGVSPIIGLYSAFFIGLIAALLGGRPGMISGATGAMAVVVVGLVAIHGVEYLFPTVMLCGLLQLLAGVARMGVLVRMVPHSVMLGFVNGLAIVICLAQLGSFQTINAAGALEYLSGPALGLMLALVALTMAIIWLLPKWTQAIPASLVAILVVTTIGFTANRLLPTTWAGENQQQVVMTVGDMLYTNARAAAVKSALSSEGGMEAATGSHPPAASHAELTTELQVLVVETMNGLDPADSSIRAGLPQLFFLAYALPPLTLETLWIILPFAVILAAVGLIESLMTLNLIDEITETQGDGNRECLGQGVANVVCGMFGGMGGCAMIGQSLINVESGGRGRTSGVVAAVCLLAFVLFFSSWIEMIPMAALAGIMFMVVIGTFEWASFKLYRRVPFTDFMVMVIVTAYTAVYHDLATAVILGVVVSSLAFAFKHAKNVHADAFVNERGTRVYRLHGPLFFASVTQFKGLFDVESDPETVVIDFYYSKCYDHSGMEAIQAIAARYQQSGKTVRLTNLSDPCREMFRKATDLISVSFADEPQLHVTKARALELPADATAPSNSKA